MLEVSLAVNPLRSFRVTFRPAGDICVTMNSSRRRENTFRIEFSNLPKKPSFENIHRFIAEALGLSKTQVVRVQINHYLWCAFVKCVDLATAQSIVQQHDNRHEIDISGKKYKLRILMEDGAVEVRLHDLSEDVSDESIMDYMSQYGQVLAIEELAWSDKYAFDEIPSGIRLVKMILKHPIKSYVTVEGETTYVTYFGQKHTCRHCHEYIHSGIPCTQNKKLLVQKASVNERLNTNTRANPKTGSYANAVKTNAGPTFVLPSTSTSPPAPSPPTPSPPTTSPAPPLSLLQPAQADVADGAPAIGMECSSVQAASGSGPSLGSEMTMSPEQSFPSASSEVVIDDGPFKMPHVSNTSTDMNLDDEISDSSLASAGSTSRWTRSKKYKFDNIQPKKASHDRRSTKQP